MEQSTSIVTGASSGIGEVTARELAGRGDRVVLICRDSVRGEKAREAIRARTGNEKVELLLADLSSQAEVRAVAQQILERCPQIHLLVNNAGLINTSRRLTVDGIEETFAVNHLAYFLLTNLLLDRIKASSPARIVNVASDAHKMGRLDFDDLNSERKYSTMAVYGASKRANILFTYELARRIEGSGVTANCVHPGAVATRFAHNNGAPAQILTGLLKPFFRSPEKGAATTIYAATSAELAGSSGVYLADCRPKRSAADTYDPAVWEKLWKVSAEMTGLAAADRGEAC